METQIFAWMMDIFFIFTLHILYRQLLGEKYKSRLPLILGWSACFLLWNVCSYLFVDTAMIVSVCTSIVNFMVLCLLYKGNVRTKAVLVIVVVTLGIIAEGIMAFILMTLGILTNEFYNVELEIIYLGNALSKLIWFVLVKLITQISLEHKQIKIGLTDWMEIFLVPVGSIAICYVIWWKRWKYIDSTQIIILAVLLVINIATYYLYQRVQVHAMERTDNELLRQQNEYFRLRYEEFEKQWLKLRRIRHDMANSCVLEMSYLEKGQYNLLMEHYNEKLGQIKEQGNIVNTGNIGIDSIINYKLEIAREHQIEVDRKIKIENEITISNIDLNILIGNLFDNAVEAVRELPADRRRINLLIKTSTTGLLLEIQNPYEGERIKDKADNFLTSKKDNIYHGLGLKEVKEIVRKYDGEMVIKDENGIFTIKTFVYMNGKYHF